MYVEKAYVKNRFLKRNLQFFQNENKKKKKLKCMREIYNSDQVNASKHRQRQLFERLKTFILKPIFCSFFYSTLVDTRIYRKPIAIVFFNSSDFSMTEKFRNSKFLVAPVGQQCNENRIQ